MAEALTGLRITLAGGISIEAGGKIFTEQLLGGRQARLVFALLVTERHRAVHHEEIADALWPDELPASWEPALRGVVSKVRAFLSRAGLPGAESITSAFGCYQIHLPPTEVDLEIAASAVEDAERLLAQDDPETAARLAATARTILIRPFLVGEEGDWVQARRNDVRGRLVRALDVLTEARMRQGEPASAVEAAEEAIPLEPFRETGYALLMHAHAANGSRGEALRTYERCRTLLVDELGVDPSPHLQDAYLTLLAEPHDHARVARAMRRDAPRHNLPEPLSSFVGRDLELAELRKLAFTQRLLTLTGAGGCGKTRLALRFAAERAPVHGDGVWLVDMTQLAQPDLVSRAVADALDVRERLGRPLVDSLIDHLRARDLLLVLDNCEHVIDACASLADALLRGCPRLRILATSREPLGVPGEMTWRVPGLRAPSGAADSLEELVEYDGPQLLCERARQARPDLLLTNDDADVVADICRSLDGLPLGIELAAGRAATMTLREIASHLGDRFRLLTSGLRTDLEHHKTLRAAVDWTHGHLNADERALFRRLSVFAGGFTSEAARSVVGVSSTDVLDVLSRLVAKSLLESDVGGQAGRYRYLETLRVFAAEKLTEAGETTSLRDAHLRWCADLVEQALDEAPAGWLARLDDELANLRAALDWAVTQGNSSSALRLAGSLALYWHSRGAFREGANWLRVALELEGEAPLSVRATALWGLALLESIHGDLREALSAANETVRVARESNDQRILGRGLALLAYLTILAEPRSSEALLDETEAIARRTEDAWTLAHAAAGRGWLHFYRGHGEAALPFFSTCLAVAEGREDLWNIRQGRAGLGLSAMLCGDYAEARTHLAQGLELARATGVRVGQMLCYLGELARLSGEFREARLMLDEAREIGLRSGSQFEISTSLGLLAQVMLAEAEPDAAKAVFEEALTLTRNIGLRNTACWWLQGLAEIAAMQGRLDDARTYLADASSTAGAIGNERELARALYAGARVARSSNDLEEAAFLLRDVLRVQRDVGDRPGLVDSIELAAAVAVDRDDHEHALALFGAAHAAREAGGYARRPIDAPWYDDRSGRARVELGEAAAADAWAKGAAAPLEDAVTDARARLARHEVSS